MPKSREYVQFEIDNRIAVVTMDRPPVNALNRQVQDEIEAVFDELETSSAVGAVIITGGGEKAFMAGADIMMLSEKSSKEVAAMSVVTRKAFSKIENFNKIVIAAVNGLALGGGCELALTCDIRVADESAFLGFPEVSLGLFPGAGGTQRLARLVGVGKAKELILTGDPINAREAKSIGLVERIAPKGESLIEAKSLANRVLTRGPIAVSNAKKAISEGINMTLEDGLKREADLFIEIFKTKDMKEGIKAFMEKRKPIFSGN